MKVSVIVIAYNTINLIPRCLDSILRQSLNDFELIVIDDGSTDGTGAVIDNYAESDSRVIAVHQNNQGIANARQKGLDLATGVYTLFIDSDDWIEDDMLEALYDQAVTDQADIVFCDYIEDNGLGTFYRKQQPTGNNSSDVLKQMLWSLHGSLWNKLIKKELYKQSGVGFIAGLNYCEDELVVIRLLSFGCRVSYVGKGFYHYDKISNDNSVSNHWAYRPVEEYDLFISSCAPFFDAANLRGNLNNRIAEIIKKLTYAPCEKYTQCRDFYKRHKTALWQSDMPFSKKLFCTLFFNGFSFLNKIRKSYQSNH